MEDKGSSISIANGAKRRYRRRKWIAAAVLVSLVIVGCWILLAPDPEPRVIVTYTGKRTPPSGAQSLGEPIEDTFAITNFQSTRILVDRVELQLLRNGQWQQDDDREAITMWMPPARSAVLHKSEWGLGTVHWLNHDKDVRAARVLCKYSLPKTGWAGISFRLREAYRKKTFRALTADIFDGKQYEAISDEWHP